MFRNMVIFYGEELLAPRPNPKLEDHLFSTVRDCLFNIFAATFHICRPFLHPQTRHAVVTGTHDIPALTQNYIRNFISFLSISTLSFCTISLII